LFRIAVLPSLKLCDDSVFCPYDMEGADRHYWQRKPYCCGAQVSQCKGFFC